MFAKDSKLGRSFQSQFTLHEHTSYKIDLNLHLDVDTDVTYTYVLVELYLHAKIHIIFLCVAKGKSANWCTHFSQNKMLEVVILLLFSIIKFLHQINESSALNYELSKFFVWFKQQDLNKNIYEKIWCIIKMTNIIVSGIHSFLSILQVIILPISTRTYETASRNQSSWNEQSDCRVL